MNSRTLRRIIEAALGKGKADSVIRNISLVNVYSKEIQENQAVGLFEDRIVFVGPDPGPWIGAKTRIVDGQGQFLLPGFIDAHTHLDSIFTCRGYTPYALLTGNTSAITEMAMVANVMGKPGMDWFMEEAKGLPLRIFFLAPALTPPFPELETSQGPNQKEFHRILRHPEVLGIGEAYWPRVTGLDPRILKSYPLARRLNKTREGHAAGARNENLTAYVSSGVTSCHEATTLQEALERLRLGLAVMIREGFVRKELEAIAPISGLGLDLHRLMLVSDLFPPEDLVQMKGMNALLAKAVALGFDPVQAVIMVTRNVADYYGLQDLGGIAPGKLADLVLVKDLKTFHCSQVWAAGCLVADRGLFLPELPAYSFPDEARSPFSVPAVDPNLFSLPFSEPRAMIRVVKIVNQTITAEEQAALITRNHGLHSDPDQDVLKMAVIQRRDPLPRPCLGFARGLGLKRGAVATSLTWDANNILVIGVSDSEMALAVNRLLELKGGWVVCAGEQILAEMPLPVMGLISEEPLPLLARQIREMEQAFRTLGSGLERPYLTLQTFCFTGLPFIRLTDKGLADIRQARLFDHSYLLDKT